MDVADIEEHHKSAREAGLEKIELAANEGVAPLQKLQREFDGEIKRILRKVVEENKVALEQQCVCAIS